MRNQRKTSTSASPEEHSKSLRQKFAAFDKQFDLGFITEKEFLAKRKRLIKRTLESGIAESELIINKFNSIIRRSKRTLTRLKQDFLLVLTNVYATKEITESWEVEINCQEQVIREAIELREKARRQKKQLEEMLAENKN